MNGRTRPVAGDGRNLRKGQFQKDSLLVVDDVDPRPIDRHYDVVLGEAGAGELVGFIEPREEQGPVVLGIVDHVLLHPLPIQTIAEEIAVPECIRDGLPFEDE